MVEVVPTIRSILASALVEGWILGTSPRMTVARYAKT
jgi:hypothetical protein